MQFFTQIPAPKNRVSVPQRKKLNVLITGITGTVANTLAEHLLAQGHQVIGVSRDAAKAAQRLDPRISVISWQQLSPGFIATMEVSAIINCAGAPMMKRWSRSIMPVSPYA